MHQKTPEVESGKAVPRAWKVIAHSPTYSGYRNVNEKKKKKAEILFCTCAPQ